MKRQFQIAACVVLWAFLPNTMRAAAYAVAGEQVNLNGFNLLCDSFDSADTNRSTDGHYDSAKRGDAAYVGLIRGIVNAGSVANADIWGYLETYVPFTVAIGPEGLIGSAAWHLAGAPGVEPGHHTTNFNLVFPDPVAPFASLLPIGGTVNGVVYTYILDAGDYQLDELVLSGNEKMLIRADATLHVRGNVKLSGNASIRIDGAGRLRLFVGGESANFAGEGIINSAGASAFSYFGLPGNTSVTFKCGSLNALVYAPRSACTISSPGNAVVELEGSVFARTVSLNAHLNLHVDESLFR